MAKDLNAELAGTLSETGEPRHVPPGKSRRETLVEILEAFLLAVVAIATAWSGYQAARWDGRQAELYAEDAAKRIRAAELLTLGGQRRLLDVTTFNTWIEARTEGRKALAELYEDRFSPEFSLAFEAWLATDPFSNPDALPGPRFMPEYVNLQLQRGAELNEQAAHVFEQGTVARRRSDDYIRATVVLATVLFLLALSQRFKVSKVREGVLVLAGTLMIYGLALIVTFPRL